MSAGTAVRGAVTSHEVLPQRLPELDGIRGLAILLVVIYHYVGIVSAEPHSFASYVLLSIRLAWTGVDLFFVLSGFLIGGILLDAVKSPNYYVCFYGRRVHRILPLYLTWLALFIAGMNVRGNAHLEQVFQGPIPTWSYLIFCQNLLAPVVGGFGAPWMGLTWSLAIEEQFYLILPPAVRMLTMPRLVHGTALVIVLAVLLRSVLVWNGATMAQVHPLLPCRADALGLGVLAACAVRRHAVNEWLTQNRKTLYGMLLILGTGFGALWRWPNWLIMGSVGYTIIAAFYVTFLMLLVTSRRSWLNNVMRLGPLRWLGQISYSVYLLHGGLLWLGFAAWGMSPVVNSPGTALLTSGVLAVVLGVSHLSWCYFEGPLTRLGQMRFRY